MCSVSWIRRGEGYELFCNRDEKRARRPELPPREQALGGARVLAPIDGDAGGSWISVNEHGLALCLLNGSGHELVDAPAGAESRGLLVLELAGLRSRAEARAALEGVELERFRPLTLLALAPGGAALILRWDGRSRTLEQDGQASMPLLSSSFDAERVAQRRLTAFRAIAYEDGELSARRLAAFHASHAGGPSAWSPCMHQEDAETRSFTRVSVRPHEVRMAHAAGPPCRTPITTRLSLPRALDRSDERAHPGA